MPPTVPVADAAPPKVSTAYPPVEIPFNKPYLTGNEFGFISEAISQGHTAGDGAFTKRCQELLARLLHVPHVLLTTSCTDALEMAALLLEIQPGDEVIVPSFTFVSTANAFALRGARPVFADIRPDTLNIDETQLERLITKQTRAIVVVHYAGVACEMNAILEIADRHGVPVIEDNAHGLFGSYHGKTLGSFGALATQSFHETKNIICGEGGALVINDEPLLGRAEILREKGTNRSRFYRGQVDKYTWVDVGSSYLPADMLAAFLYAQLEHMAEISRLRRQIYERYHAELQPLAERGLLTLPVVPADCGTNHHLFHILLADLDQRSALLEHLKRAGILATFHYVPLHTAPVGVRFGYRAGMLPVTESLSDRLVRLPFYAGMSEADVSSVVSEIGKFLLRA